MISVMNNDYKFDKESDTIEESKLNARVSDVGVDSSNEEHYSNLGVDGEVRISSLELDSVDPENEVDNRVSGNRRSEDVVFCSTEEARVRQAEAEKGNFSHYNSLLSEFDDYVASEKNGEIDAGLSSYGFEVGDMVWGKVKSHPWWPGHIFNESFASPLVRRTRREGHVLVAFFGDSSYGWFELAELVPFDSNYAEKSRQISSRTFVKAVEEAVDEVSRRRGLGLACTCRNPRNFRLTNVEGYFSVDVPDYEPGGVYSSNQISKARNSFKSNETLAFIKQLALAPRGGDHQNINLIKNKATVFAYRKAVFEQYDDTYAQAFGVQPVRPSLDQPVKEPSRAPLSGPLVIAEALRGGKNPSKSMKGKENSKKDRYLLKRRDGPSISKSLRTNQELGSSSAPLPNMEESSDAVGDYVLQKRGPTISMAHYIPSKDEETGFIRKDGAASTLNVPDKEAITDQVPPKGSTLESYGIAVDTKPLLDKGKGSLQKTVETYGSDNVLSTMNTVRTDVSKDRVSPCEIDNKSQSFQLEGETSVDVKYEESEKVSKSHDHSRSFQLEGEDSVYVKNDGNAKMPKPHYDFQKHDPGFSSRVGGGIDLHQVKDPSPIEVTSDGAVKKVKSHKRPVGDLNSESCIIEERKKKKKKKKKKKELISETNFDQIRKPFAPGKVGSSFGKSNVHSAQNGLAARENISLPMDGIENVEVELAQLLNDLQALALDPFHGVERNVPAIVWHFFSRFRSLVYQKSLVLSPLMENESPELWVTKSPSGVKLADGHDEHVRVLPPGKPVKQLVRPDDPTKAGRKRAPSDRQEEIAAKRLNKIKDLKTLAGQKKAASLKTSEAPRGEGKAATKPVKTDSVKKVFPPAKTVDPTLLVIKFPPQTSLPSLAELKARFARFGPIDQSGLRVFWKSFTCRVLFLHKLDAQAAYKYAVGSNSLFGNVNVRCYLRDVGDPAAEASEAVKARGDDDTIETARVRESPVVQQSTSSIARQSQTMVQLKSCLKKSSCDESGQVTGNGSSKGMTPRVKFMLGGEESNRGEQLMVGNRNTFKNANFADGGATSSVAMDYNSKKFQKFISHPQSPILPLPPQFAKAPQNDLHNFEKAPRNIPNFVVTTNQSAPATTVDISQQMISLLTRCNDVVTNLTGLIGYVPYHPL
ncbi:PWWP protein [Quillaja saponaria]|uniref:PWWP protein n=1 Tax=Quillaja saponaria TaxID=32244 RepID=A0AAD7Q216_QUISA|nr:PWWP protein [Quillaja saponaria]